MKLTQEINLPSVYCMLPTSICAQYSSSILTLAPHLSLYFPHSNFIPEIIPIEDKREQPIFIIFDKYIPRKCCSHFLCDNFEEFSLFFHPWALANYHWNQEKILESKAINLEIECGAFLPYGIIETHQERELLERGIKFNELSERKLILHDNCFSPCNNQIMYDNNYDLAHFYTYAKQIIKDKVYTNLAFHILPITREMNSQIQKCIENSKCVEDLIINLESSENQEIQDVGKEIYYFANQQKKDDLIHSINKINLE